MKYKKAFTIVELLATIVVISILAAIIIPNITRYMNKAEKDYNEDVKKQMLLAGENFYGDHKNRVPTDLGTKIADYVTLKELASSKYLSKNFIDYKKNDCMDESFIVAYNEGGGPKYQACMICNGISYIDKEKEPYCTKFKDTNKDSLTCKVVKETAKQTAYGVELEINVNNSIKEIYSYNEKKEKTNQLEYFEKNKKVLITDYGINNIYVKSETGNVKIYCGNVYFEKPKNYGQLTSEMYLVSKNQYENHKDIGFTKSELDNLEKYNGKEWTNKYIYVKLKYNINDFDKVTYKNTKTNDTKEIKINASDNIKYFFIPAVKENETKLTWNIEGTSSNKDISPVQNTHITQIDITPPPIPTKDNSSKEEWTNQNVTIDSESKDELSGTKILEYSTDKTNWTTLALGTTGKKTWTNAQNRNITMYIRAVDNVGNTSNESLTKIKIDIVKPNVTNIDNPQTGWTNADVNIKTTASDDLSGIAKIQYNISPGTTWSNFAITQSGLSATASKIYADAAIPLKIRTIDNAGNVSDTKSTNVKIDKIKPNSPQVSKFEFNSNVRDYRTNCIGKGDTQSDTQCNICILFTAGKKYDFSAKRSITDNGGSGLNSSAKQNIWNHNGDATKYSSWVVFPSTFGWNATKTGTYLNNIWINFGERGVDNAGNIGYALTIHYYIYDTNKTTNYNSCVSTYIK